MFSFRPSCLMEEWTIKATRGKHQCAPFKEAHVQFVFHTLIHYLAITTTMIDFSTYRYHDAIIAAPWKIWFRWMNVMFKAFNRKHFPNQVLERSNKVSQSVSGGGLTVITKVEYSCTLSVFVPPACLMEEWKRQLGENTNAHHSKNSHTHPLSCNHNSNDWLFDLAIPRW